VSAEFLARQEAAARRREERGRGNGSGGGGGPPEGLPPGCEDDFSPSINPRSRELAAAQGTFEERQRVWEEARRERLRQGRAAERAAAEAHTFSPALCPRSLQLLGASPAGGGLGAETAGRKKWVGQPATPPRTRRRRERPGSAGPGGAGERGAGALPRREGRPRTAPAPRRPEGGQRQSEETTALRWKTHWGEGEFWLPGNLPLMIESSPSGRRNSVI